MRARVCWWVCVAVRGRPLTCAFSCAPTQGPDPMAPPLDDGYSILAAGKIILLGYFCIKLQLTICKKYPKVFVNWKFLFSWVVWPIFVSKRLWNHVLNLVLLFLWKEPNIFFFTRKYLNENKFQKIYIFLNLYTHTQTHTYVCICIYIYIYTYIYI